jgi:hypothetical protein
MSAPIDREALRRRIVDAVGQNPGSRTEALLTIVGGHDFNFRRELRAAEADGELVNLGTRYGEWYLPIAATAKGMAEKVVGLVEEVGAERGRKTEALRPELHQTGEVEQPVKSGDLGKCPDHPDYRAERRPSCRCSTCWDMWERCANGNSVKAVDPLEVFRERRSVGALRTEHKELLERLNEAERRQTFLDELARPMEPLRIERREKKSHIGEATAIALLSDVHFSQVVLPETVAGRNRYNLEIAERRLLRFFDRVRFLIELERHAWKIRDLVLWFGGDLISGHLREEAIETSALAPVEESRVLRRLLEAGIRSLLEDSELESIIIPCSYGNHGRTTVKPRVATGARNSFEWLLYHTIAESFANEPRVHFDVAAGAHCYVDLYGKTVHFTHGDEVKFSGGIGGLSVPLLRRVARWETIRPCAFHCIGHYHQLRDFKWAVTNGSVIGLDPFGMSVGAELENPEQSFLVFDSVRGKASGVRPIWCESDEFDPQTGVADVQRKSERDMARAAVAVANSRIANAWQSCSGRPAA